jgi:hypothetical protein
MTMAYHPEEGGKRRKGSRRLNSKVASKNSKKGGPRKEGKVKCPCWTKEDLNYVNNAKEDFKCVQGPINGLQIVVTALENEMDSVFAVLADSDGGNFCVMETPYFEGLVGFKYCQAYGFTLDDKITCEEQIIHRCNELGIAIENTEMPLMAEMAAMADIASVVGTKKVTGEISSP